MQKKATINDVAAALGLSRNTVSKALNNPGSVPAATRQRVVDMALAMDYKSFGQLGQMPREAEADKHILLICKENQLCSSFFGPLIRALHEKVRLLGGTMTAQFLSRQNILDGQLPAHLGGADGILAIELLEKPYIDKLLATGPPMVFFDFYHDPDAVAGLYDMVMEQGRKVYDLTRGMLSSGAKRIGFVGEPTHCYGFKERFHYYRMALMDSGAPCDDALSITDWDNDLFFNAAEMEKRLKAMNLPDGFICANDYVAFQVMAALERMGKRVPDDIQIAAFDNVPEAALQSPGLTSVEGDREELAAGMAMLLFDRMKRPGNPGRILYTHAQVVKRGSTFA